MSIGPSRLVRALALFLAFSTLGVYSAETLSPGFWENLVQPPAVSIGPSGESFNYDTLPDPPVTDGLTHLESYGDLLAVLKQSGLLYRSENLPDQDKTGENASSYDTGSVAASAPAEAPAGAVPELSGASGGDYSTTNTQTEGVDEGDILKTDGRYLYTLSDRGSLFITETGTGLSLVSATALPSDCYPEEFYVIGDRLAILCHRTPDIAAMPEPIYYGDTTAAPRIYPYYQPFTLCLVYDIANRAAPQLIRTAEWEGNLVSSRLANGQLYFSVSRWIRSVPFDGMVPSDILPAVRDTAISKDLRLAAPDSIYWIPGDDTSTYLTVGVLDLVGDAPCIPMTLLGSAQTMYMSAEALYLAAYDWNSASSASTRLYKFGLSPGGVSLLAEGLIPGSVINQYALDEWQGYLRVATTVWTGSENTNGVYILDSGLNLAGSVTGLAPGESIQSVRFMGGTGYVVTYRNTDPLFAIDLSVPYAPRVMGELKIPGFSQYLHPVGDGLVLGFGRHTAETFYRDPYTGVETPTDGTIDLGVKIALFDVSDPYNLQEIDRLVLPGNVSSDAFHNPRALMADSGRGIYAFPADDWSEGWSGALVIGVEGGRVFELARLAAPSEGDDGFSYLARRLCYVGTTLYMVAGGSRFFLYDYPSLAYRAAYDFSAQDPVPINDETGIIVY